MKTILVIALILAFVTSEQLVPIPPTEDGF